MNPDHGCPVREVVFAEEVAGQPDVWLLTLSPCGHKRAVRGRPLRCPCRECPKLAAEGAAEIGAGPAGPVVAHTARDLAGPYSIGSTRWPGLSKLIEETGEALQVAGKLIATGGEERHFDGSDLRERLTQETADVAAAVQFFTAVNGLDTPAWRERVAEKVRQFERWHAEQGGRP